jgi:general stress protein 26
MASLEEVSKYPLDEAQCERLFSLQRTCVVCWTTKDGWPVGVTHRYIWRDGRIWVTTSSQRHRVAALRKRPKSCVVISGDGTEMGADVTLTLKTTCTVQDDREKIDWFLDEFLEAFHPGNPDAQKAMRVMMDTPRRVILELVPEKWISYDGMKLAADIAREGITDPA